jgi:hypothetical protein
MVMKPYQIINKPKHPKKGEHKEQNGSAHIQEDKKEPPKRANHKGNIKFPNPLMSREAYQMEPPKRANHKGNIKFPNPPHVTRSISNEKGRTS